MAAIGGRRLFSVFERFTERARQVVVLAQDEARALRHNYIGTEHLLLGLIREEEGLAARVLASLGITIEEVRAQVIRIVGQGDESDHRPDPVHATCEEDPGARASRRVSAGAQLHRDRAHPSRTGERGHGSRGKDPPRPRPRRGQGSERDHPRHSAAYAAGGSVDRGARPTADARWVRHRCARRRLGAVRASHSASASSSAGPSGVTRLARMSAPKHFRNRDEIAAVRAETEPLEEGAERRDEAPARGARACSAGHGEARLPRPRRPLRPHPAPLPHREDRRGRRPPRGRRRRHRLAGEVAARRAVARRRRARDPRPHPHAAPRHLPRRHRRRSALPPPLPRPADERGVASRRDPAARAWSPRSAPTSTPRASSRSRRRSSSRATAAASPSRS